MVHMLHPSGSSTSKNIASYLTAENTTHQSQMYANILSQRRQGSSGSRQREKLDKYYDAAIHKPYQQHKKNKGNMLIQELFAVYSNH